MDIRVFDRGNDIAPLLVDLYDTHESYERTFDKTPNTRTELTDIVVELFNAELSFSEQEMIADILIELLRRTEIDLRAALAQKLSESNRVPLRLILQFANDEIEVAQYVLRNSPQLGEIDLIYLIKYMGAQYCEEIAKREDLTNNVVRALIEAGDEKTIFIMLKNKSIEINKQSLMVVANLTQKHPILAVPLLRREEMDHDIAARLYQYVNDHLKRKIIKNFTSHSADILDRLDSTIIELAELKASASKPKSKED